MLCTTVSDLPKSMGPSLMTCAHSMIASITFRQCSLGTDLCTAAMIRALLAGSTSRGPLFGPLYLVGVLPGPIWWASSDATETGDKGTGTKADSSSATPRKSLREMCMESAVGLTSTRSAWPCSSVTAATGMPWTTAMKFVLGPRRSPLANFKQHAARAAVKGSMVRELTAATAADSHPLVSCAEEENTKRLAKGSYMSPSRSRRFMPMMASAARAGATATGCRISLPAKENFTMKTPSSGSDWPDAVCNETPWL